MKPVILIDSREQLPFRFSDNVETQVVTLSSGDYSVIGCTDTAAIERKSLADFVASITFERERFWECCDRLSRLDFACIVVECALHDVLAERYRSRTRPQSVVGSALAIHVDFGVPVIWAGDRATAANVTERLLTRVWRKRIAEAETAA